MSSRGYGGRKKNKKEDEKEKDKMDKDIGGTMSKLLKYDEGKKGKKQSDLSDLEIKERLRGFKLLKDNSNSVEILKKGMYVRYFAFDDKGNKKFRMGGIIQTVRQFRKIYLPKRIKILFCKFAKN